MAGGLWSPGACPGEPTTRSRTIGTVASGGSSSTEESIPTLIVQSNKTLTILGSDDSGDPGSSQHAPRKRSNQTISLEWRKKSAPTQSSSRRCRCSRYRRLNPHAKRKITSTWSSPLRFPRLHRSLPRGRSCGEPLRPRPLQAPVGVQVLFARVAASWSEEKVPTILETAFVNYLNWVCERELEFGCWVDKRYGSMSQERLVGGKTSIKGWKWKY